MRRSILKPLAIAGLVALCLLYLLREPVLVVLGEALVAEDRLAKADAIVVLAGEFTGERELTGADLYRQGFAPRIVVSGGPVAAGATAASLMKRFLVGKGVPEAAIVEEGQSLDTVENACMSLAILRRLGARRVIVVTSPYHTARARRVFAAAAGGSPAISIRPASPSWFDPRGWWKSRRGIRTVFLEYEKALGYLVSRPTCEKVFAEPR